MLVPKTGGNLPGLLSLLAFTNVSPQILSGAVSQHWAQREPRGAQGSRWARSAQSKPLEGESILPAARTGVFKVSPHYLWPLGKLNPLESVSGGEGKELFSSCHFCPHLLECFTCCTFPFDQGSVKSQHSQQERIEREER